jgi:hypothetical protein
MKAKSVAQRPRVPDDPYASPASSQAVLPGLEPDVQRSAFIDPRGTYRYSLERQWAKTGAGAVLWIMLNPSTADAEQDDPTVRRCMSFSRTWGYDALAVANLFALRATNPRALQTHKDPVGPLNDQAIASALPLAAMVVAAWGNAGPLFSRDQVVRQIIADARVPLFHLGLTSVGQPSHPLYLRRTVHPVRWNHEDRTAAITAMERDA